MTSEEAEATLRKNLSGKARWNYSLAHHGANVLPSYRPRHISVQGVAIALM
jgi:hypothetical protein